MTYSRESYEALQWRIRAAIESVLGDNEAYEYEIVYTFPDSAILRNYETREFLRIQFEDNLEEISLTGIEKVEETFVVASIAKSTGEDEAIVQKNLNDLKRARLCAPILKQLEEKHIAYGPVLIPDEPDSDGDIVSVDQIETAAHKFLRDYGNIDLQHSLNVVARPVESFIAPVDLTFGDTIVPKGSWLMGIHVDDEDTWKAIKTGKISGFSIMAIRKHTAEEAMKSDAVLKRATLADLGDDWEIPYVSVVDVPAVPKAKFVLIKSEKKAGAIAKLTARLFGNSGLHLDTQIKGNLPDDQANTMKTQGRDDDVDEIKAKEMIDEAVAPIAEAIKGLSEALEAVSVKQEEDATTESDDLEALKSQLEKKESQIAELSEFKTQIEKRFGEAASKSLAGQDDDEPDADVTAYKSLMTGRDAYGRKVRSTQ